MSLYFLEKCRITNDTNLPDPSPEILTVWQLLSLLRFLYLGVNEAHARLYIFEGVGLADSSTHPNPFILRARDPCGLWFI